MSPKDKKAGRSTFGKFEGSLILDKLPGMFLIVCLVVALGFLLWVLRPFLTVLFIAAVLAVAFYPVFRKLNSWFGGRSRIASLVSCLMVVLVIVVPITVFILLITSEGIETYESIRVHLESGTFDKYLQWEEGGYVFDLKNKIEPIINMNEFDIKQDIINLAQEASSFLVSQTLTFVQAFGSILMGFFIMLFAMYYFFKDGRSIVDKLGYMSPLPSVYESELFTKMGSMVKAIVFGVFFTAILQGIAGGVGFAIAGIESAFFWGAVMAFLSLLPVIGTAIIWGPACIILVILGDYWSALFLALWGVLLVGSIDNIARTYLIGGKARTYPLLTFFVILGGIWTMGLKGVVIGPLILMLLMSFIHIYEAEYTKVLKR